MKSEVYDRAESIKLLHSGSEYFDALCEAIKLAKRNIHLHTYIFSSDKTGERVKTQLINASCRGVKVFLLLDSYGSKDYSDQDIQSMKESGIILRFFSPGYRDQPFRLGRRLHHKLVVIDDDEAIVGGLNISDNYSGYDGKKPWLDYAVHIHGEVCKKLSRVAMSLFNRKYMPVSVMYGLKQIEEGVSVRFRQSDYIRGKKEITVSYKEFIQSANEEIIIVNAYFLPGYRMRRMLQKAIRRGVRITVLLSASSDVPLVKRAMNYYYAWLFRNHIQVYEYLPSNVHAKLAVFDKKVITLGSFNLNYLSEYVSVELNVDIQNDSFTAQLSQELHTIFNTDCRIAEHHFTAYSNLFSRFLDFISYQSVMYAMRFLYLITRKDRLNILK